MGDRFKLEDLEKTSLKGNLLTDAEKLSTVTKEKKKKQGRRNNMERSNSIERYSKGESINLMMDWMWD